MADPKDDAERLLVFYLRAAWEAAGKKWDSDNDAEVGAICDLLVKAAREEQRR